MNTYKPIIKQSIIIFIMCFIFQANKSMLAQTSIANDQIKLGLELRGGGAHIGVLKVLEENNITIPLASSNSLVTIVGALYSIGYSAQNIENFGGFSN